MCSFRPTCGKGLYSLPHEFEDALVEGELEGVHDEDAGPGGETQPLPPSASLLRLSH